MAEYFSTKFAHHTRWLDNIGSSRNNAMASVIIKPVKMHQIQINKNDNLQSILK